MQRIAKKTMCTVVSSAVVIAGATAFSTAAAAARPSPAPTRIGASPIAPSGSRLVGNLAASAKIDATVTLLPSNAAALSAYATAVSTPGTKQYRHYLSTSGFAAAFGPSASTVSAVEAVLKRDGLSPGAVSANHLAIRIHGTSARMAAAFQTTFRQYIVAGGRVAYANTSAPLIDGSIAGSVQSVIGLNDLVLAHHQGAKTARKATTGRLATPHVVTGGPQPCTAAKNSATANNGYTADQLASAYNLAPLYQAGDLGAGQTIAMYELEPNLTSDIAGYKTCYGVSTPISYSLVDGGSGTGAGVGEAVLDIDNAIGVAPKASQIVYQGPNSGNGGYDTYNAIITADVAKIISTSWGVCEADTDNTTVQAENTLFQEAASQGQSLFDAAGDNGSEDCGGGSTNLSADDPGGQPFVTVVGGTTLQNITGPMEKVWNDRGDGDGAGGGGISQYFPMPSYQTGAAASLHVINANSSGTPCGAAAGSYCREEPDVSLVADPETPFITFYSGAWSATGGTSGGAPFWAGFAALINASAACNGTNIGFANPKLYSIAAAGYTSNFHDITSGNNDYTGTTGLYPSGTAFDMASGLGTPNGANLAASFCPSSSTAPAFTADTPPTAGTVGTAYSYTYVATGNPAPTFAVATGTLPAGLSLNATTGVLSGTPTTAGPFTFTVSATNGVGSPAVSPSTTITIGASGGTAPTVDKSVTKKGSNSVTASLSTTVAGDTVVAFVSGHGSTTVNQQATVTGGGLTWTRVTCTCARYGTAEVWKALATGKLTKAAIKATLATHGYTVSETVIAFSHTAGVGAKASATATTGSPSAVLTTTAANSLVFGVGADLSAATARTVGANQALFSQVFSGANTYWVQKTTSLVAASGTAVTINDPSPAGHRWSLAIVEIL